MGERLHTEWSKGGRALAWGLILLLLTSCAPSFVKPTGERRGVFPYAAFGSFLVKSTKGTHRGMWEIKAWSPNHYRLTLYSSVGTLIGCTEVQEDHHTPCKRGIKDLANTKAWNSLPRELFLKLPLLLSGDLQRKEGKETLTVKGQGGTMKVKMLQREDEPFPHPLFVEVELLPKGSTSSPTTMRIQVEEISKK